MVTSWRCQWYTKNIVARSYCQRLQTENIEVALEPADVPICGMVVGVDGKLEHHCQGCSHRGDPSRGVSMPNRLPCSHVPSTTVYDTTIVHIGMMPAATVRILHHRVQHSRLEHTTCNCVCNTALQHVVSDHERICRLLGYISPLPHARCCFLGAATRLP